MVRKTKVDVYQIDRYCINCGEGTYKPSARPNFDVTPIVYPHRCDKCGHEEIFKKPYPAIIYQPVDNTGDTEGAEDKL